MESKTKNKKIEGSHCLDDGDGDKGSSSSSWGNLLNSIDSGEMVASTSTGNYGATNESHG